MNGRLIILSGPSGSGKTPLLKALKRFYPEFEFQPLVLYNSRAPRPGEEDGVDYHFRTRAHIQSLANDERYVVLAVRGDLQALDLAELLAALQQHDVLFEGNPTVGRTLQTHPRLAEINRLSVFLSPLSRDEIQYLQSQENVSLPDLVTDVMRRKLLRRTQRQKQILSLPDLENIEVRAGSACEELKAACHFDAVIPNHDGEDSENWDAFYYPLGDARKALVVFAGLLNGTRLPPGESWEADLFDLQSG